MINRAELFLISREVIDAATVPEFEATYADMQELDIHHMPYGLVDIDVNATVFHRASDGGLSIHSHYELTDEGRDGHKLYDCKVRFRYRDGAVYAILVGVEDHWLDLHKDFEDQGADYRKQAERFKKLLVVVLATKEIVKTRTKDKLLAMGIGKGKRDNHRPIYTTTISLPLKQFVPSESGSSRAGISPRPHLRRGHARRQRHGPHFEFVKKIFVPPCFVNADEHYVSTRFSYNTGLRREPPEEPPHVE